MHVRAAPGAAPRFLGDRHDDNARTALRRGVRHHLARRPPGGGRHRDRRGQAAHRRAARPPRCRLHRGGLAGRQPQGHRVLRPRRARARARHLDARGVRVDPPATGQGRRRRHAAQPGGSGHERRVHRRQELGVPRDRGPADHPRRGRGDDRRLGAVPPSRAAAGCSSTWSTSSTATRPTRSSRCGRSRRPSSTGPPTWCCATRTAARCPTRWAPSSPPCTSTSAPTSRSASTATTTPAAPSPTRWPRSLAGAGHVQGTLNGLGERTGNANLTTIIPNLELKLGYRCLPDGTPRCGSRREPPRRRAAEPGDQPAGAVRRVGGVRPQGRAARERHRPGQGRL